MPPNGKMDQFANMAIISVEESAANTLTFKKLETGISIAEKVAWVVNQIEYLINSVSSASFNHDTDALYFGMSVANTFATPALEETTILDHNVIQRMDVGVAASGFLITKPIIKDFSTFPGGGLLVPPTPFYAYIMGVGLGAANKVIARIHYTLLTLAVDQYWELVEARRVLSS